MILQKAPAKTIPPLMKEKPPTLNSEKEKAEDLEAT